MSDEPRSRRALLAGALGGFGVWAAAAIAQDEPAAAAAGDAVRMGRTNKAAGTNTVLQTKTSGSAYRVQQAGAGVAVEGTSAAGHGALLSTGKSGKYGVLARNTAATSGSGAALRADGGHNTAVQARTANAAARAVDGRNSAASGAAYGVYGLAASPDGAGVRGENSSDGPGVWGVAANAWGVYGQSNNAAGVHGSSDNHNGLQGDSFAGNGVAGQSTNNCGVYARSFNYYSGYFDGSTFAGGYVDVLKIAAPAAPDADNARLFVQDGGSGKLQLCVLFPTGAVQVLATEP